MGLLGKLLSVPIRILNVPIRTLENLTDTDDEDRVASRPLDELADELEDVDEDE